MKMKLKHLDLKRKLRNTGIKFVKLKKKKTQMMMEPWNLKNQNYNNYNTPKKKKDHRNLQLIV